jgi:site-specific DNA-cytosine methylase
LPEMLRLALESVSGGGNRSGPIEQAACLTAKGVRQDFEVETFIAQLASTLPAGQNSTGGNRQPGTSAETAGSMLIAHSLRAEGFDASEDGTGRGTPIVPVAYRTTGTLVAQQWAVRRLTPTECERLQGFPDGWTATPDAKGKTQADGPRYKQLGNSMAVPVIAWIGRRALAASQ